jgi:hypothetical protein
MLRIVTHSVGCNSTNRPLGGRTYGSQAVGLRDWGVPWILQASCNNCKGKRPTSDVESSISRWQVSSNSIGCEARIGLSH